jgi:hypothetical protein
MCFKIRLRLKKNFKKYSKNSLRGIKKVVGLHPLSETTRVEKLGSSLKSIGL